MENVMLGVTSINDDDKPITMTAGYQIVCSNCGEKFFLSRDNVAWFLKKDLEIPKKCPTCRKKSKDFREHGVQ